MAEYYSLALDFTAESNSEATTALLSNRCLALINLKKFKEALLDADNCTKIRPKWFRVGSNLCHWRFSEGNEGKVRSEWRNCGLCVGLYGESGATLLVGT